MSETVTNSVVRENASAVNVPLISEQRLGRIVAVTGGHAIILLDYNHESKVDEFGRDINNPEIGTLLKVDTEVAVVLALVSALSAPAPTNVSGEDELRIVEVELIGELPKDENGKPLHFRRGISSYPALGDVVARASSSELTMVYSSDSDSSIRVGSIQQDSSIPAMVKVDDMLGKHMALLGTTGTGKSCSTALIFRRILERNPNAHILMLDIHREYAPCFKEWAEVVTTHNLSLPFWLLNFEESVEIIIGGQLNRDQDIEILRELIPQAKMRYMGHNNRGKVGLRQRDSSDLPNIGVDTPVPYRAFDLISLLDDNIGKLEMKGELAPYKRLKARLEAISRDPRYSFMFGSLTVHDTMAEVIGHLFRIPVNDKPITILELGGLPSEIINVVVSVLARMAFDFGVWSQGKVPITFVCEEAHRYVPNDSTSGFEPTKRAISRIAKEGRKYGVSLCIVTQRPAELDPTILSQCNTIFSLRLSNEKDQEILKAGISDAAASLLEFMPTMGAGEAVAFGEGLTLPTRIKFDLLPSENLPSSTTASFSSHWQNEISDPDFLQEVVVRWRRQSHRPLNMINENDTAPCAPLPGFDDQQSRPQQPATQPQVAPQPAVQPQAVAPQPTAQPQAVAPQPTAQQTSVMQPSEPVSLRRKSVAQVVNGQQAQATPQQPIAAPQAQAATPQAAPVAAAAKRPQSLASLVKQLKG